MKTLCVVDMQKTFIGDKASPHSYFTKVTTNVIHEIRKAKQEKHAIVVVEYKGSGDTVQDILDEIKNYPRAVVVQKTGSDGSAEVLKKIKAKKFPTAHIKMCGVYAGCCVMQTAVGMLGKNPKIKKMEILQNATDVAPGDSAFEWYEQAAKRKGADPKKLAFA